MIKDIINIFFERKEFFLNLLWEHIQISLLAICIAGIIGLLLGILISEYKKSSKIVLGIINFIYTIPSISLLGFLIPFSGIGNTTAIIALTVYALLPMVRNTHTGIVNIDKNVIEAAKGMGSTNWQILYKIKLPLALPVIMSGLRNMVTMTIALAGIASFIGAGGLGVAIYRGITTNNSAMVMVGSLLIALLAIVVDIILGALEKLTSRNTRKTKKKKIVAVIIALSLGIIMIVQTIASSALENKTINIATKPMTEQYILGDMLKEIIEKDTNLHVKLTQGVGGGTSNIQPGMIKGEFDIYPEYTGTGWNTVLKRTELYNESMFDKLLSSYKKNYNMTWTGMYGFNNTYGLVVRKEIAKKYNLKTYSDLAKVADKLIFGAEYDFFEREDGYNALCKAYNMKFKQTMDLDIGLKYQAINQEKIDAMNIFTTDGQLSVSDVVILKDDKKFYPSYMCGNVVREKILEKYPELQDIFNKLDGILTDSNMAHMNYQVETKKREPADVAHEFLVKSGLVK